VKAPTVSKTDPVKETIKWLKNTDRQYIIKYTEPETAVMLSGALSHIKPPVSEWRIAKPAAFIYRELMNAAENSIISLGKNAIADFMINNLKKKDGKDITIDSLIKAKERTKSDKSRQIPTK
jgi:hypothetical protein